jgi:VanZ family protein
MPDAAPPGPARHLSSAVPLALLFTGLVVYASLYPFTGWFWPAGAELGELLVLSIPRWRIPSDMWFNFLGYLPLGALFFGAGVRSGGRALPVWLATVAAGTLLSYLIEPAPSRVPRWRPCCRPFGWWTAGRPCATAGSTASRAAAARWR